MFLLLLTMPGSQADEIDWENLSNKELHDKFQQMMTEQVQDVLNNFEEAMEKIDGMENDRGKGVPSFDEMMDIALVAVDFDDPTTNVRGRRANR